MNKKIDFLDIIAYISIILAFLWFILKVTGIIKTPLWFELLPLPLGFALLASLYFKTDKTYDLIEPVEYREISVKKAMKEIEKYVAHRKKSFWMEDIIKDLKIEPKIVLEAVQKLEKEKKIRPVNK